MQPLLSLTFLWRPVPACIVWLSMTMLLATPAAAQNSDDSLAHVRDTLGKRIEIEHMISKEKNDWRVARESLRARNGVMRRDIDELKKRIDAARQSISEAQKKLDEMQEEKGKRDAVTVTLEQRIAGFEQRIRTMLPRLPEPLAERIRPLSQRLPDPAKEGQKELSLSERYQNVIGVLNEIGKWNRSITVTSEERRMMDGTLVAVSVIYIGLGQGYYCGRPDKEGNATVGGVGTATAEKWQWKLAPDVARDVQAAIRIYNNEQLAALVRLPVQIL